MISEDKGVCWKRDAVRITFDDDAALILNSREEG